MTRETYTETVYRFVVEYLEDLPPEHRAQMRLYGIDPDDNWQLKWSFHEEADAVKQMEKDTEWLETFCKENGYKVTKKYRVRDLGATQYIERSVMF